MDVRDLVNYWEKRMDIGVQLGMMWFFPTLPAQCWREYKEICTQLVGNLALLFQNPTTQKKAN